MPEDKLHTNFELAANLLQTIFQKLICIRILDFRNFAANSLSEGNLHTNFELAAKLGQLFATNLQQTSGCQRPYTLVWYNIEPILNSISLKGVGKSQDKPVPYQRYPLNMLMIKFETIC